MQQLKEVFIYNETYPLPKEAHDHYRAKVDACSGNPMCLNNVKSDVESFIAKWGRKSGVKLSKSDESGFTILKEHENFKEDAPAEKKPDWMLLIAAFVVLYLALHAITGRSLIKGGIAVALFFFVVQTRFVNNGNSWYKKA